MYGSMNCEGGSSNRTESDLERVEICRSQIARPELYSSHIVQELANIDFKDENLEGRDLPCANLQSANLERANLAAADLPGANLRMAYLNEADLPNANPQFADLLCADVTDADFEGIIWNSGATCGDGGYPWRPGTTGLQSVDMEGPGTRPFGAPASLPTEYPSLPWSWMA